MIPNQVFKTKMAIVLWAPKNRHSPTLHSHLESEGFQGQHTRDSRLLPAQSSTVSDTWKAFGGRGNGRAVVGRLETLQNKPEALKIPSLRIFSSIILAN